MALKTPSNSTVYSKFFDGADPDIVRTVLTNIALGTNVAMTGLESQPIIICANPDVPVLYPGEAHCKNPEVESLKAGPYVILCPTLFNPSRKTVPDSNDCVGPLPNGAYSTGQGLARTTMSVLLHELVHIYVPSSNGGRGQPKEYYGIHAVLDLRGNSALNNPANWVFYIASKPTADLLSFLGPLLSYWSNN